MPFDPARPDGTNASLTSAISPDGTARPHRRYSVPARCGVAVRLTQGQQLEVINTPGTQVCDFWAFAAEDPGEYLSMDHVHTDLGTILPRAGDRLVSNLRRPLLTITRDSSPGIHDTVIACCDHARYRQLGCTAYHDNCADNLRMALTAIGLGARAIPAPFNLWMNIPVAADGTIEWRPPVAAPGDSITFEAHADVIAVMSACPQDLTPVNGADHTPSALHFQVTPAT